MRRLPLTGLPLALALVLAGLVAIGGGGAVVCKVALNCHLRGGSVNAELDHLAQEDQGVPATLRPGLREIVLARGLHFPTDVAFLPGGKALVAEKSGVVELVGGGRATQFLDLRSIVATAFYRGLMAVAVDPAYRRDGYVYLLYAVQPAGAATAPTTMRLARVRARGNRAARSSLRVILGSAGRAPCDRQPAGADCLPSDRDHDGGSIAFAPDGTLFVSTGDGGGLDLQIEPGALAAQQPDALGGKLLRITRDGKGLPSNPYWNGDPSANRSKVWAVGLRNPFRMSLAPGTTTAYVGDVGSHAWEELDVVERGGNYGWPCYEGPGRHALYARTKECVALFRRGRAAVRWPALVYPHRGSVAITGGVVYTGPSLPGLRRGDYVFADWVHGWIKTVPLGDSGRPAGAPRVLATNASGPVAIVQSPDGRLCYLAIDAGELRCVVRR